MAVKPGQPYYAWVRLNVGGTDFILDARNKPQFLLSFRHTLTFNHLGSMEVEIFDSQFTRIEYELYKIVSHSGAEVTAEFQYGYTFGQGSVIQSPKFYCRILSYTPRWTYNGVILTISGEVTTPKNMLAQDFSFRDMDINEIVEEICKRQGWQLVVNEPAEGLYVPDYLDTTIPSLKHFQATGITPVQFILRYLCPYAKRKKDGKFGYVFQLEDTSPTPKAKFYIPEKKDQPPPVKTFTIRKDKHEEWLDFSYDLAVNLGIMTKMFEVVHRTIPAYNGHMRIDKMHVREKRQHLPLHEVEQAYTEKTPDPNVAPRVSGHKERTEEEIERVALHELALNYATMMTGTLSIVGDPEIDVWPGDIIYIQNYLPDGTLHYSSGRWRVKSVVNEISGGSFTTTYELERNTLPHKAKQDRQTEGVN